MVPWRFHLLSSYFKAVDWLWDESDLNVTSVPTKFLFLTVQAAQETITTIIVERATFSSATRRSSSAFNFAPSYRNFTSPFIRCSLTSASFRQPVVARCSIYKPKLCCAQFWTNHTMRIPYCRWKRNRKRIHKQSRSGKIIEALIPMCFYALYSSSESSGEIKSWRPLTSFEEIAVRRERYVWTFICDVYASRLLQSALEWDS
jgi:hypothetical protein